MLKKLILCIFVNFYSLASLADTVENGSYNVSQLRFGEGGLYVALNPVPAGCGGGAQYGMHFKLDPSAAAYHKEMISGLLAAYTAGQKISHIWFRNEGTCSNNHILHLYMFQYEAK